MTSNEGTDTVNYRLDRERLVASDLTGVDLARALSAQVDGWFRDAAAGLPPGWALMATAGYADGMLSPGSDLDVLMLHPRREGTGRVNEVARALWYPFWDAGLKLSPAVHHADSILRLASSDLVTMTSLLRLRVLGGDTKMVDRLAAAALKAWTKHPRQWLAELDASVCERHDKAGEVAFLLEPNVKEGRGGLRDVQAIDWALRSGAADIERGLVQPLEELHATFALLCGVRSELHRVTGRPTDVLLLQEQDAVAARLGYDDADLLIATIAEAARSLAWASDRFWDHVRTRVIQPRRGSSAPVPVASGLVVLDGALHLTAETDASDPTIILRTAAAAAQHNVLPSLATLQRLAAQAPGLTVPWTEDQRVDFLGLLGSGSSLIGVVEALDQHGLFQRVVPEWQDVRSRPQRNAYHTYTVDRHLLTAVVEANALVRSVRRPDLLLLGAFLHDIGKCGRGDHTLVGMELTRSIAARMGLPQADIDTLVCLVECHLLLPETATRRDVHDPGTAELVARAVGNSDTLELLVALTQADSLATGPSAWTGWKAELITDLALATTNHLRGRPPASSTDMSLDRHADLLSRARVDSGIHLTADAHTCTVVAPDRRGLFALITGVLAGHGVEVLAATVSTTDDGLAVDDFRITRSVGGAPDWPKVKTDLEAAVAGRLDIEARIERRQRAYRRVRMLSAKRETAQAALLIDNETSVDATIVEVRAPDAPALLFRLANVIARLGLDIRHAKVATLGHEVVDVFYVRNGTLLNPTKLTQDRCDELRSAIRDALLSAADLDR
jgi:[protein-PII] uridylyltransferase